MLLDCSDFLLLAIIRHTHITLHFISNVLLKLWWRTCTNIIYRYYWCWLNIYFQINFFMRFLYSYKNVQNFYYIQCRCMYIHTYNIFCLSNICLKFVSVLSIFFFFLECKSWQPCTFIVLKPAYNFVEGFTCRCTCRPVTCGFVPVEMERVDVYYRFCEETWSEWIFLDALWLLSNKA